MQIKFGRKFAKQYDKLDSKIKLTFKNKLALFQVDPFNPLLNNHSLIGSYSGYRSINVTGDFRALYSEKTVDNEVTVTFELIGTHSQLYR